jgi:hypothetical protein
VNVLDIVNAGLLELGNQPVVSLIDPTVEEQVRCKAILQAVAREVRSEGDATILQKRRYGFLVESGRSQYPLPRDYHSLISDTPFNVNSALPLIGPISDGRFTFRSIRQLGSDPYTYRVFGFSGKSDESGVAGGQLELNPTPANNTDEIYFEYNSKNLFLPKPWAASTSITNNSYRTANGMILLNASGTNTTDTTPPDYQLETFQTGPVQIVDGAVTWDVVSTAYESVLADDDIPVFDDEVMIEGFKYRYLRSKEKDYAQEYQAFKKTIDRSRARWVGSRRGSFNSRKSGPRYVVPDGGWVM